MEKVKKPGKHGNSAAVKAAVFFLSLAACLTALELGLRLTGFALASARRTEFVPPFDEKPYHVLDLTFERYRWDKAASPLILALGDSLTNGGNVKSHHSYPYFLYKKFEDAGKRAAVYNMGSCEDSTFGVSAKLGNFLRANRSGRAPDAVVVLVGAADLFNIPLVREKQLKEDSFWHDVLPRGWIYSLRLYKVYRHIKLSLSMRGLGTARSDPATFEERLALLLDVYERHKKALDGDRGRKLAPELVARITAAFPDDIRLADLDVSLVGDFADLLTDYAGIVYAKEHRYDDFFGLLLDLARTFPEEFLTPEFDTANYHFIQAYQVQSRYTARDVLAVLDASKAANPGLAHGGFYRHVRRMLENREELDRFVDKKRLEAWAQIVRLSKEKGIRLVLMNYPVTYKSANAMLDQVSEAYGLPLVDNRKFFADLIAKDGRAKYLEDDDHLTPLGYELMAGNAFQSLSGALSR